MIEHAQGPVRINRHFPFPMELAYEYAVTVVLCRYHELQAEVLRAKLIKAQAERGLLAFQIYTLTGEYPSKQLEVG